MCRKIVEAPGDCEHLVGGSERLVLLSIERAGIGVDVSGKTFHIRIAIVCGQTHQWWSGRNRWLHL